VATGSALIPHDELQELMDRADVVVCHGGPTTIMEARRRGITPVVVARSGRLGEHVDGHQELFADRMARRGLVARPDAGSSGPAGGGLRARRRSRSRRQGPGGAAEVLAATRFR
jgi:UDP-N-acetylglucosamine transferase subunit ALG13